MGRIDSRFSSMVWALLGPEHPLKQKHVNLHNCFVNSMNPHFTYFTQPYASTCPCTDFVKPKKNAFVSAFHSLYP